MYCRYYVYLDIYCIEFYVLERVECSLRDIDTRSVSVNKVLSQNYNYADVC